MSTSFSAPAYVRLREQIRADVVCGRWKLGQHITLAELTACYGVSANPIREALHQLQGEGLVEMRQNRGAIVRKVDIQFVKNMYDVRGVIEGLLAGEAARLATSADVSAIEDMVLRYEQAVAGGETLAIVAANRALHRLINRIADNPVAMEIFDGRSVLIDALRLSLGTRPGRLQEIVAEHRAIFRTIADHDVDAATKAAQQHTRRARDHMIENLQDAASSGA